MFLVVTAGLLPLYLAAFPFGNRARRLFSKPFYRTCVALTGLRLDRRGLPAAKPGTLYVANHASYLDIPVLAALIDGRFVAKAEVRGWPLFGFLATIGRTIYVSRQTSQVTRERLAIARNLADGEAVILFPEGSSSDGSRVLPFRTGLLSAAHLDTELDVMVQPISIAYGPAIDQNARDRYAWYGDMDMLPHLLALFAAKQRVAVEVRFHAPRRASEFADRRALARWAETAVAGGLAAALNAGPRMEPDIDTGMDEPALESPAASAA